MELFTGVMEWMSYVYFSSIYRSSWKELSVYWSSGVICFLEKWGGAFFFLE